MCLFHNVIRNVIRQAGSAFILVLGLLAFGPPGQAADEFAQVVEGWSITSVRSEQTREFEGCWMGRGIGGGRSVSFLMFASGEFVIALSNTAWKLPKDKTYTVELLINGLSFGKLTAGVSNENAIYVVLNNLPAIRNNLKQGSRLTLRTPGKPVSVSLKGSAAALSRLEQCFAENKDSQAQTPRRETPDRGGQKTPFVDFPKSR